MGNLKHALDIGAELSQNALRDQRFEGVLEEVCREWGEDFSRCNACAKTMIAAHGAGLEGYTQRERCIVGMAIEQVRLLRKDYRERLVRRS